MTVTLAQLDLDRADEGELLWQYVGNMDMHKPLEVHTLDPADIAALSAGGRTLVASFKSASTLQRKIVAAYAAQLKAGTLTDLERIIVVYVDALVDGHHRAMAALKANKPLLCVDLSELPE